MCVPCIAVYRNEGYAGLAVVHMQYIAYTPVRSAGRRLKTYLVIELVRLPIGHIPAIPVSTCRG